MLDFFFFFDFCLCVGCVWRGEEVGEGGGPMRGAVAVMKSTKAVTTRVCVVVVGVYVCACVCVVVIVCARGCL